MSTPSDQLCAMRALSENWDGYGAAAPQAKVIELADEFVGLLGAMLAKSPAAAPEFHVSPTRIGGVLIEWEDGSSAHELDLSPDGSIGFLHHDKATGAITTRKVPGAPEMLHELAKGRQPSRWLSHIAPDKAMI